MRRPVGVKSILFLFCGTSFSPCRGATVAMLPSALSRSDSFSLGACWAFSLQPALPSDCRPVVLLFQSGTWARPLTQSPELGFWLCLSFYAAAATVVRLLWCNGSYASPLTHR